MCLKTKRAFEKENPCEGSKPSQGYTHKERLKKKTPARVPNPRRGVG
jgi:hypothetical protein